MAKLSSHIAYIISSFYHTLLELHAIPDFCLSRKKNKKTGKVYLYKQESTSKGRKQTKIKASKEAHYLELYAKRQKLKARLRELKAQYKKLSFKDRRDVRYALACFQHALDLGIGKNVEKNTYLDGTTRDSKSEIILSLLFDLLGIKYTHNYPLYAQGHSYMVDFYFPDSQDFHEHMGMLDDEQYAQNQKRKLEDYAAEGIQEKKNLLITKEHFVTDSHDPEKKRACIDLREIVLQLISFGKVAPQRAFHLLFPDKPLPKI